MIDAERGRRDRRRRRARGRRRLRRPVPDRRVPDRLGHLVEHERQRGDRHPGQPGSWARPVHPNDHVNASQSSNDVFPSSIHLAATAVHRRRPAARRWPTWRAALEAKAAEFETVVKAGRTHLMDATPVTLGQEFGGYAAQVRYGDRTAGGRAAPAGRAAAGRHRRRHRDQHPARLRRRRDRQAARVDRAAADRGAQPLRGAGRAGRAGGDVGAAADRRGRPLQDRQRHPLDGLRPPRRPARAAHPRPPARLVDHARQGQPGGRRGDAAGLRPGDRQRRDRRRSPARRATSS